MVVTDSVDSVVSAAARFGTISAAYATSAASGAPARATRDFLYVILVPSWTIRDE
jgi:hypothetical protein